MIDKTAALQNPEEIIKSPVIAEFPGFRPEDSYLESELEFSIITHIRDFLMEMGRGFSFVATSSILLRFNWSENRNGHPSGCWTNWYVCSNVWWLKCKDGDNPTTGILLCSEISEDIARYSVLHDKNRLFMSKHLTVTPDKTNSTFFKIFFGEQTLILKNPDIWYLDFKWWSIAELNRWPFECHSNALPTELIPHVFEWHNSTTNK